jgi:hypothetical protein
VGYSLAVAPQNRREDEHAAGYTSGSSGLLRLEKSWTRVSQSSIKTSGGAARMVQVPFVTTQDFNPSIVL